ncbi:hypothetical protein BOTBODRAFT_201805 [Botryobasidium botryosum FD-172 SS1]|uniref:C2H2-type domain-containing protein n=1 Tax=Botryobasidium botryosum (strain FD-172 SS1) TaxID=930990 RepID=A0A067NBC0_BOTB1|nr:hypothetical protein BOTBODRAFT_201805 [Botryobasidium botryosum FD-172 SS1]
MTTLESGSCGISISPPADLVRQQQQQQAPTPHISVSPTRGGLVLRIPKAAIEAYQSQSQSQKGEAVDQSNASSPLTSLTDSESESADTSDGSSGSGDSKEDSGAEGGEEDDPDSRAPKRLAVDDDAPTSTIEPTQSLYSPLAPHGQAYPCPKAGCSKSYKQKNGLRYHLLRGRCSERNHSYGQLSGRRPSAPSTVQSAQGVWSTQSRPLAVPPADEDVESEDTDNERGTNFKHAPIAPRRPPRPPRPDPVPAPASASASAVAPVRVARPAAAPATRFVNRSATDPAPAPISVPISFPVSMPIPAPRSRPINSQFSEPIGWQPSLTPSCSASTLVSVSRSVSASDAVPVSKFARFSSPPPSRAKWQKLASHSPAPPVHVHASTPAPLPAPAPPPLPETTFELQYPEDADFEVASDRTFPPPPTSQSFFIRHDLHPAPIAHRRSLPSNNLHPNTNPYSSLNPAYTTPTPAASGLFAPPAPPPHAAARDARPDLGRILAHVAALETSNEELRAALYVSRASEAAVRGELARERARWGKYEGAGHGMRAKKRTLDQRGFDDGGCGLS